MTLSDKKITDFKYEDDIYFERDVKAFIKRCELRYLKQFGIAGMIPIKIMKEEAGDKLI